jgi:hypothetical protein
MELERNFHELIKQENSPFFRPLKTFMSAHKEKAKKFLVSFLASKCAHQVLRRQAVSAGLEARSLEKWVCGRSRSSGLSLDNFSTEIVMFPPVKSSLNLRNF